MGSDAASAVGGGDYAEAVLIAFEGGEGSGKSTQIDALANVLRASGQPVLVSREPGATEVGRRIRDLVLHTDTAIAPRAEALLFAADRAHHVHTVVEPALAGGEVVLLDRYIDSSIAYQGAGRDLAEADIRRLSEWATGELWPDLTVLLDVPVAVGLERAGNRSSADRLERESLQFHERVRQGYLRLAAAEPQRYLVLDATRQPADLSDDDRRRRPEPVGGSAMSTATLPDDRTVWRNLIGQPAAVAVLRAAAAAAAEVAAGRSVAPGAMTHAWLFTGPPGRAVRSRRGRSPPRLQCIATVRRAAASARPAARCAPAPIPTCGSVVPEGLSISVAEIRGVVAAAARRPSLGRWQVVVFEDADR